MVAGDLTVFTSRSGLPTLKVNGMPYYSEYDPLREVSRFFSALPIENADVIFMFGWGLGYCGNAIQGRLKPAARVIVFEPNAGLFELSRTNTHSKKALQDSRFQFVVGEATCRVFDTWALDGRRETDKFLWLEWPASATLHTELLDFLKAAFKTRLRDKAGNLLTHFERGGLYFENALANFRYQTSPDVRSLFGRFTEIPLVLVSAGPSLDRNIDLLQGVRDRCFILAVDTALRPLLAAGVTPHAVIAADPSELNARHVRGVVPESIYMIAEQAVHPSALAAARQHFLFGLGLFPDPLFKKFGFAKTALDVWGSVSTAALDLACRIGSNPIIFTGQDFAYSWGRDYARHTIYDGAPFSAEAAGPLVEPDIWGNPVRTTENLVAYRDAFIRKMRQRPEIRFINATEGGILRENNHSLEFALRQFCQRKVDVTARLREFYRPQQISPRALEHLLHVLKSRRQHCGCLPGFLELVAKQEQLLGNGSMDSPAIDRKIHFGIEKTQLALDQFG